MEVTDSDAKAIASSLGEKALAAFSVSKGRIYDVSYTATLVDGTEESRVPTAIKAVVHPFDSPHKELFTGKPLSTIDSFIGIAIGEDGIPETYTRKISGAVCTAYSASSGRGAGGQGLYCGTVAVNSSKIPYGTRLYIRSSDGKFVYGFAIATDTGGAMMSGRVDIDLYFESNAECNAFGKRNLDVYVLD